MNWIIIIILIVLAFVFLRMKHMKHKVYMVVIILVLLFVYVTAGKIIATQSINLKSSEGIINGAKLYFAWLGGVADNFKNVAGNAIKMDWKLNNTETSSGS